jgi:glucose-1-phosphate cytidylyltransferase
MKIRTAVILCGGKGTRLGNLSKKLPKTLVKIQGKPIIWYIINTLKKYKFNHFILPLGYKGHKIKKYLKNICFYNTNIECVNTGVNSNIGKRIYKVKNKISSKSFLLLNGDAIFKFDLNKIFLDHEKNNIDNTFISNEFIYPYGTIGTVNGKITDFKRNLEYNAIKIKKLKYYLAYNYSGISIMKLTMLNKYCNVFKNTKNFELSIYPKIIKNNKTKLIKTFGLWHSVDNIKDFKSVNSPKNDYVKFTKIKKLKQNLIVND